MIEKGALAGAILVIQIKYGLPYCVTCPIMSTDPGIPPPGYSATPRTRVVGSRDLYEYWDRWHSLGKTYLICIRAQVLENYHVTPYWHFVSEGGSVSSSWKWIHVIRSPAHNPLLQQLPTLLHSMALADIHGIQTEFIKFCCGYHLHSL